jgi:hypothetical protein
MRSHTDARVRRPRVQAGKSGSSTIPRTSRCPRECKRSGGLRRCAAPAGYKEIRAARVKGHRGNRSVRPTVVSARGKDGTGAAFGHTLIELEPLASAVVVPDHQGFSSQITTVWISPTTTVPNTGVRKRWLTEANRRGSSLSVPNAWQILASMTKPVCVDATDESRMATLMPWSQPPPARRCAAKRQPGGRDGAHCLLGRRAPQGRHHQHVDDAQGDHRDADCPAGIHRGAPRP